MTTRQRADFLAHAYPRLFSRRALHGLLRMQLGDVDALDKWIRREGTRLRARAPEMIYHVCAGNLAVSAQTSIALGLLLGARNVVKLPGEREDSSARREILEFIRGLPAPLRRRVETHRKLDAKVFAQAEAIVAFGSDATMEKLRGQARWDQRFLGHGHAASLLWLAEPDRLTAREAAACAIDILTYDQLGCLSPQAIYFPRGADLDALGRKLSGALERAWRRMERKPARPLPVTARISEARDLAWARGHRVWLPAGKHAGWTIIFDPDPVFKPSPLHGVIYLRQISEAGLQAALRPIAGRISTVGSAGKTSSRWRELFLSLGVSRFCEAGRMQFPPLSWHHDGRPALGDLVTWIDAERAL
jgi:hypothetical protein